MTCWFLNGIHTSRVIIRHGETVYCQITCKLHRAMSARQKVKTTTVDHRAMSARQRVKTTTVDHRCKAAW